MKFYSGITILYLFNKVYGKGKIKIAIIPK